MCELITVDFAEKRIAAMGGLEIIQTLAPLCESEAPDSNVTILATERIKQKYTLDVIAGGPIAGMVLIEAWLPVTAYETLMAHLQTL